MGTAFETTVVVLAILSLFAASLQVFALVQAKLKK
jgi:hypothetical protein